MFRSTLQSIFLTGTLLAGLAPAPALSASPAILAVVTPESGPFAALGEQVFQGARQLADERKLTLVRIAEPCEAGSGDRISTAIVAAKAAVAIGFLCGESFDGGGGRLKAAGIPAISVSVRSKILFEDVKKEDWPIVSIGPGFDDEAEKLAEIISRNWHDQPFAMIDDGTLSARELVEAVRNRLEPSGLKPQFSDTFRPGLENQIGLVRRLQKAGATHVLFGGDRNDAAIIMRDSAEESINLQLLGGEALNAADRPITLADGVNAVLPQPIPELATSLANTLREKKGILAEGYVLPGYAAASIAAQIIEAAQRTGKPATDVLKERRFETVMGPFSFGPDNQPRNPYILMQWRDGTFQPAATTE